MNAPHIRIRLDLSPLCSIGPGKVALLEAVESSGSLSGAARLTGMSYRRAWVLLEELNASFRGRVTESSVGGAGGGGVTVTALGREVIAAYRGMERAVDELGARHLAGIARAALPATKSAVRKRRSLNRR
jgi:molybdate transport system regulatory protein